MAIVDYQAEQAGLRFVLNDHLGTPALLTDIHQQIVWRKQATPFGDQVASANVQRLRFPGQYADGETEYSYNYFRDYDPSLGRYIQSDPIGLNGGINTFGYVTGNPNKLIDFYGLAWFRLKGAEFSVGRLGTSVETGCFSQTDPSLSGPFWNPEANAINGGWLGDNIPGMNTMGILHDGFVGFVAPNGGWRDTLFNIPSMPFAYVAAALYETGNSIAKAFGYDGLELSKVSKSPEGSLNTSRTNLELDGSACK